MPARVVRTPPAGKPKLLDQRVKASSRVRWMKLREGASTSGDEGDAADTAATTVTLVRRRGRRGAAGRRRERRLALAVFRAAVFYWVTRQRRVAD